MSLTSYDALPSDKILYIGSFCSFDSLEAYSRTNKFTRENCGMLKLNAIYCIALNSFKNLKIEFRVKKTIYDPKNVYVVNFKNFNPQIKEDPHFEFDRRFAKDFGPIVGYVFEKNEYFTLEDSTDLLKFLKPDQFMAAARLDAPISDVEVPPNTNFITGLYFKHINPDSDTSDLTRTITYPIKEVRCLFAPATNISPFEVQAINKAATKAFEPPKSFLSSFTLSSNIDFLGEDLRRH